MSQTSPLAYMRRLLAETEAMMSPRLRVARSEDDVFALAADLLAVIEEAAAALPGLAPLRQPACRVGCDTCCRNLIQIRPPFAVLLARHILASFSGDELAALLARLASGRRAPCPLLVEGSCSVYAARPMVCRGYYSFDAALCAEDKACEKELGYQGDDAHALHQMMVFLLVLEKKLEAIEADHGLEVGPVFLDHALRVLLTDPTATARWLAGERVFSEPQPGKGSLSSRA